MSCPKHDFDQEHAPCLCPTVSSGAANVRAQLAFIVRHPDVDATGVYKAETASKARYAAYLQAQDAGFYDLRLIDFRVARAKQYDDYKIDRNGKALEFVEYYAP